MSCHFGHPHCDCKAALPKPPADFDLTDLLILPTSFWPPLYIANLDDGPPPDKPFVVPAAWLTPEESGISLDLPASVLEEMKTVHKATAKKAPKVKLSKQDRIKAEIARICAGTKHFPQSEITKAELRQLRAQLT